MQTNSKAASLLHLLIWLISFGLLARAEQPTAWTITTYFEYYTKTYTGYKDGTISEPDSESTILVPATPTVSQPRGIETTTSTQRFISGLVYVSVILEPNQAPTPTTASPTSTSSYGYKVAFDLTMPTGCTYTASTGFVPTSTRVTDSLFLPPDLNLAGVVTPISVATYLPRSSRIWYLEPSDVPRPIMEAVEDKNAPQLYQRCERSYYHFDGNFSDCFEYRWWVWGNVIGGGFTCSNGIFHTWGLEPWSLAVTISLSWVGFMLFIGLWESYVQFRRMMMGQGSRRGIPFAWTCFVPVLGFVLLRFRKDGFACRSRDERDALTKQWKAMSVWKRLKLWLRYGFTFGYPPILGTPPPPRTLLHRSRRPGNNSEEDGETGVELAPPPYTREQTSRTSADTDAAPTPDPTADAREPPTYSGREETQ